MRYAVTLTSNLILHTHCFMSNSKELYDSHIVPIVQNLKIECKKLGMPVFTTVCYDPGDKKNSEPQYGTDFLSPYDLGTQLPADNYISGCIKVTNGFKVVANDREAVDLSDFVMSDENNIMSDENDDINENEET